MLSLALFTGIGLALFLLCVAGLAWAVRNGQMDDLESPALRMLIDDEPRPPSPKDDHG